MEVGYFQVSLKHLTMQEEGEEHCQLLWFSVRGTLTGHIQTAASCGLWSTRIAEGRTGGVKCVVTLPQNVFPSLQLSAVLRVAKKCCMFVSNNARWEKIKKNLHIILQICAVSMLLIISL